MYTAWCQAARKKSRSIRSSSPTFVQMPLGKEDIHIKGLCHCCWVTISLIPSLIGDAYCIPLGNILWRGSFAFIHLVYAPKITLVNTFLPKPIFLRSNSAFCNSHCEALIKKGFHTVGLREFLLSCGVNPDQFSKVNIIQLCKANKNILRYLCCHFYKKKM